MFCWEYLEEEVQCEAVCRRWREILLSGSAVAPETSSFVTAVGSNLEEEGN